MIGIGYPCVLLNSAITISKHSNHKYGLWRAGEMGRGGQRLENLRWDESRIRRWGEGEWQGGYRGWDVWEGVW
jgi:hypothetical protein